VQRDADEIGVALHVFCDGSSFADSRVKIEVWASVGLPDRGPDFDFPA